MPALMVTLIGCGSGGPAPSGGQCVGCSGGSTSECVAPSQRCTPDGGTPACVDLTSDPANCGGCGNACDQGNECVAGACVAATSECPGGCPDGLVCVSGTCEANCSPPQTSCPQGATAACTNLATDVNNCGACGNGCTPGDVCITGTCGPAVGCEQAGLTLCDTGCTDVQTDPLNCGGCGFACPTNTCVGGFCQ